MKDSIRRLREKLEGRVPSELVEVAEDRIVVRAASEGGYAVSFYDCGCEIVVGCGGWHEHFTDANEAERCFFFAMSGECRLKVHCCGSFEYRWTLQQVVGGEWEDVDETGLLFFPFWRRRSIKYLRNEFQPERPPDEGS